VSRLLIPSYAGGFAPRDGLVEHPGLWDGLVGYWPMFLGPSGTTLHSWSGRGNNGTLTNMDPATDWVPTEKGWSLNFDGNDDHILVTSPGHDFDTATTIVFWVNQLGGGSGSLRLFDTRPADFHSQSLGGWIDLDNNEIEIQRTGVKKFNFSMATNTWYQIVIRYYGGTQVDVYVNGEALSVKSGALLSGTYGNDPLTLFQRADINAGESFFGLVSLVALYNRILTISEIQLLHSDPYALSRLRRRVSVRWPGSPWYAYLQQVA